MEDRIATLILLFLALIIAMYILIIVIYKRRIKEDKNISISRRDFILSSAFEEQIRKKLKKSKFLGVYSHSNYLSLILFTINLSNLRIVEAYHICYNSFYGKKLSYYCILQLKIVSQVMDISSALKDDIESLWVIHRDGIIQHFQSKDKILLDLLFIFSDDFNIHLIDLEKTITQLKTKEEECKVYTMKYLLNCAQRILDHNQTFKEDYNDIVDINLVKFMESKLIKIRDIPHK